MVDPGGLLFMGSHRVGHDRIDLATAALPHSDSSIWKKLAIIDHPLILLLFIGKEIKTQTFILFEVTQSVSIGNHISIPDHSDSKAQMHATVLHFLWIYL